MESSEKKNADFSRGKGGQIGLPRVRMTLTAFVGGVLEANQKCMESLWKFGSIIVGLKYFAFAFVKYQDANRT